IEREFAKLVQLTPEELDQLLAAVPEQPTAVSAKEHGLPSSERMADSGHQFDHDEPPGLMDGPVFDDADYAAHDPGVALDEPAVFGASPKRGRANKTRSVTP